MYPPALPLLSVSLLPTLSFDCPPFHPSFCSPPLPNTHACERDYRVQSTPAAHLRVCALFYEDHSLDYGRPLRNARRSVRCVEQHISIVACFLCLGRSLSLSLTDARKHTRAFCSGRPLPPHPPTFSLPSLCLWGASVGRTPLFVCVLATSYSIRQRRGRLRPTFSSRHAYGRGGNGVLSPLSGENRR